MTTKASAYGATSVSDPLEPLTIERRELGAKDVHIDIKFCGICHSDIHFARGEWGEIEYPLVPGHEIAGIVTAVGPEVKKFKEGDRVGVGCLVNSCGECSSCKSGEEQYCIPGATQTYGMKDEDGTVTQGGYSSDVVVVEDFVVSIPDEIELDKAAPLLCAGITTYSPLHHWEAGPGKKVGVVGFGGLGHMAVKIAHAMGAEVTVLSRTLSKEEDGKKLGADHYYATEDEKTFEELEGSFDLIINTVSAKIEIDKFLGLLGLDGTLVNVGAPPEQLPVNAFNLIGGRKSFAGSMIGGLAETQQMLDFCAEKGIVPEIEIVGADDINDAWERVLKSDVRYRFVIDSSTLASV
jgi:uncharacterized zinc-type alcohol dehydrogenase-like protein